VSTLLDGLEPMWAETNRWMSILSWLYRNKRIKDEDVPKAFAAIRYQLETDDAEVNEWRRAIAELARNPDARIPE